MKWNWQTILGGLIKGAEVAAPIVATKKPGIGKALDLGAEAAKKATEKEPKK